MNRLQSELHRLYGLDSAGPDPSDLGATGLDAGHEPRGDAAGRTRALVLELAAPADWVATCAAWHGVQADLDLPAPAIAVNGADGYQLWFALAQPVPVAQAAAFLDGVRVRYLHGTRARRVTALPTAVPAAPATADLDLPPRQIANGIWSAFVAPDLAPMFADEPWLDMLPGLDGQAGLLAGLKCMAPDDFLLALDRLQPAADGAGTSGGTAFEARLRALAATGASHAVRPAPMGESLDPRRFLLDVMNDPTLALALRIEAAKALLPFADGPSRD